VKTRAPQKRRLQTRSRLLEEAEKIVAKQGYSGLRVEEVVARAGVAKGTLFSHFKDKDGLLAVLIGAQVMAHLDQMESRPAPKSTDDLISHLSPLLAYVAQDRMIFDVLLRYSGSTGAEVDEVVTEGFMRQITLFARWLGQMQQAGQIRSDASASDLAEGVQAFLNHVLALWFCAEHSHDETPAKALAPLLHIWLRPPTIAG